MATVFQQVDPGSMRLAATAMPELVNIAGTNFPAFGLAFDDGVVGAREDAYFNLAALLYGSGNLTLRIRWYSRTGQVAGAVVWGARIAAITAGTDAQSYETKAFAAAQTANPTVIATARALNDTSITISNLDSLAALDEIILDVYRDADAGGDTMTGDAIIVDMVLSYSDV